MPKHPTATRDEWLSARLELLEAEKELTRRGDELAERRRQLPWVPVEKDYRFETEDGDASLADLFAGNSQLLVYHFMFGPDYTAGCVACSAIADGFNDTHVHLANHDVTLMAISRAPIEAIRSYRQRMGWTFPWASSDDGDFNYDFSASFTTEQRIKGDGEYNFQPITPAPPGGLGGDESPVGPVAAMSGVDSETYMREAPGVSAFILDDGVVYHTYSAYARGVDALWGMYQWLDRAPLGRNETDFWFRRRDEY